MVEGAQTKGRSSIDSEFHMLSNLEFCVSICQGWKPIQENTYLIKLNFMKKGQHLFAIFDGHNGPEVAHYARRHLDEYIQQAFLYGSNEIHLALKQAFLMFDESLLDSKAQEEMKKIRKDLLPFSSDNEPGMASGSEAILGIIKNNNYYIASTGESRCIVIRKKDYVQLYPHPTTSDSDTRLEPKPKLNHVLGDHTAKANATHVQYTAEPIVFLGHATSEDIALLMFSKGVGKAMDDCQLAQFVKDRIPNKAVKEINEEIIGQILGKGSEKSWKCRENLTVLLVKLSPVEERKEEDDSGNTVQ